LESRLLDELVARPLEQVECQVRRRPEAPSLHEHGFLVEDLGGLYDVAGGGEHRGVGQALLDERQAARKARQFGRADELRARLEERGILIEDTAGSTRWRRKR